MSNVIGTYRGHEVQEITVEEYFKHKSEYDEEDVMYMLTAGTFHPLVHRGTVICFITDDKGMGRRVLPIEQRQTIEQWLQETGRPVPQISREDAKKRGNPTRGVSHEVTTRRSVDYYMQHTIDVLNEGIKYGEEQLQKLSRHNK